MYEAALRLYPGGACRYILGPVHFGTFVKFGKPPMRHFFVTSALVCLTLLLTGVMDRGALFSSPPNEDTFLPRSEAAGAGKLLERVLAGLAGDRLLWLEMSVRQKMLGDDPFDAEGRFLLGPDQRMRLELRIATPGRVGRIVVVSNGSHLWRGRWVDDKAVAPFVEALPPPGRNNMRSRQEFLEARGLSGLLPLLRQIRQCLQEPVQQAGYWHGKPAIQVSGAWNAPEHVLKTLPPDLRARRCNIILDAETLWPHRIEWLGSPRPLNYPVALLQMDFRDHVINRALSPSECAREFRFP
jgi:hypothetical protein